MKNRDILTNINTIITEKDQQQEADLHYQPPRVIDGLVQGAVTVSEGDVVEQTEQCVVQEQMETSETPPVAEEHARVEADDAEVLGEVLAGAADIPLVYVEGEGDAQGGSADMGEVELVADTITIDSITADTPRVKLAELTMSDPTLKTARLLAEKEAEGYH